ncbi:MAG TPA: 1,4-alpha-glucan branching enzyme [Lachnospiraceae bacterium]|nr:1,4-alpha-glucan branching enzyme [Lachnospiraceae bacterium]
MDKKLYKMMNWAEIEALVYAEEDRPHELLGGHFTKDGILIQAFFPDVRKVSVVVQISRTINEYDMELMDEAGFYAVLIRAEKKNRFNYCFKVTDNNGNTEEIYDPYSFAPIISKEDAEGFIKGTHHEMYKVLGAHVREIDGIKGTGFALWAPNAIRASVVGAFNNWDGRVHQMRRLSDYGIFEIFIPGIGKGEEYKFELRLKGGVVTLKKDPYAFASKKGPDGASVVCESGYEFHDEKWLSERKKAGRGAMSVYEVDPFTFSKPGEEGGEGLKELSDSLVSYVKDMGYTYVELMPVMQHEEGGALYEISSPYAVDSALGDGDGLKYLIDRLHGEGIGVILDWVCGYFTGEEAGLSGFDGTCLYGHQDLRQRYNGKRGTLIYNYARPEVSAYLLGNASFWLNEYHADGLKVDSLEEMIYLDFGKKPGDWLPNEHGGKENLDAIAFLKKLNSVRLAENEGYFTIADGLSTWAGVTAEVSEEGMGFDYKLDKGFTSDLLDFLSYDPFFRTHHYGELTYALSYNTSERFILPFSVKEVEGEDGTKPLLLKMPGGITNKYANLRAAFGFMAAFPAGFVSFMGQDMGCEHSYDGSTPLDMSLLEGEDNRKFNLYIKELLHFYSAHPALFEYDGQEKGFEWINNTAANDNVLVFLRKGAGEKLLIVLNFANVLFSDYRVGVPSPGKYKEIFNSDAVRFGGGGSVNPRVKTSKKEACDGRKDSIRIKAAPLSVAVFKCD